MMLTNYEKFAMRKRLESLKQFLLNSLESNKVDDYLNTVNSRELRFLEETLLV